jgi:uncharacterized membrane protein YphA (DoxX/SURF4 family)
MSKWHDIKIIILKTGNDNFNIFIRLIVGLIFMSEGIQKYLFLEAMGPVFFEGIGFRNAFFWAYFTGAFEIVCGTMILFGFIVRVASIPLLIIMLTAFITTKLPLLKAKGFFEFAHVYNIDFSLTILLIVLIIYGGGKWSFDLRMLKSNP